MLRYQEIRLKKLKYLAWKEKEKLQYNSKYKASFNPLCNSAFLKPSFVWPFETLDREHVQTKKINKLELGWEIFDSLSRWVLRKL